MSDEYYVGQRFTYNKGRCEFLVIHIDDKGRPWGTALRIVENQYGTPALVGSFSHINILGDTCAGLARLPDSAVPIDPC